MCDGVRRRTAAPTPASRWSRSAATAAPSWRRTPTSTWCWCTTTRSTRDRWPRRSGTRSGTPAPTSTTPSGRCRRRSTAAADDLRVALGLLDVRHLAGDPNLTLRLRTTMLAAVAPGCPDAAARAAGDGRAAARPGGRAGARLGARPQGGRRAACATPRVLKALVATWLVDVPHADLERSRQSLLDVRDLVQEDAGRPTDRIGPEAWSTAGRGARSAGRPWPPRCTSASWAAGSRTSRG